MASVIAAIVVMVVVARGYLRLARRRRWRGEVYPASLTVPRRTPHTMRIRVSEADAAAAIGRWGAADQRSLAWVRAPGQLRWHQATVFVLEGGAGLIADPLSSLRRRYVFDGSCRIGPSDAVMTFPLGRARGKPRVFHALCVADAAQTIDLAVEVSDLSAVLNAGAGSADLARGGTGVATTAGEPAGRSVRLRNGLIGFTDRLTLGRRALRATIDRQSRARRSVSAACAAGCAGMVAAISWISGVAAVHHVQFLRSLGDLEIPIGLTALGFAFRAMRPRRRGDRRDAARREV